jgi:hypothetical protein
MVTVAFKELVDAIAVSQDCLISSQVARPTANVGNKNRGGNVFGDYTCLYRGGTQQIYRWWRVRPG